MRYGLTLFIAVFTWAVPSRATVDLGFASPELYTVAPGTSLLRINSATASAQLTTAPVFVGTGQSGGLDVTNANTVINVTEPLTSNAAAGTRQLAVPNGQLFTANMLVLVMQMQGATATLGNQNALTTQVSAGFFELVRVQQVNATNLSLQTPLINAYSSILGAQVVSVPEYTEVRIESGASIVAPQAWDGHSGGVVALAAASGVTLLGSISADGQGFRGGAVNSQAGGSCGVDSLSDTNQPPLAGDRGEGLAGFYGAGRGNLATAAGGGNPLMAGGGGGGAGGAGGVGGAESSSCSPVAAVGGLGGVSLTNAAAQQVILGGGGGAGQQDGGAAGAGGGGGGAVLIFGSGLIGSPAGSAAGVISAHGIAGGPGSPMGGGGGGGAGGSIYLLLGKAPLDTLTFDASGGAGGATASAPTTGPGGGGGGGRLFISSGLGSARADVSGGAAGLTSRSITYSAVPGTLGTTEEGAFLQLSNSAAGANCLAQLNQTPYPLVAGGQATYLLSRDGGANWEYFDGTYWVTGAYRGNAQDANAVNAHIYDFAPVPSLNVRIYLATNSNTVINLDDVTLVTCRCGDDHVDPGEECDDGNQQSGDGCNATCVLEAGYSCIPGHCVPSCGNGIVNVSEECDDGNLVGGDGCGSTCDVEAGWACFGAPSQCLQTCGNGTVDAGEACDDGNLVSGDGCSSHCSLESGYACDSNTPNRCYLTCGDASLEAPEQCDDGNHDPRDGCAPTCGIEPGWSCCMGSCFHTCGDGSVDNGCEECDDGNIVDGDGCSSGCTQEVGWACAGQLSHCSQTCGNGKIDLGEQCDDGNLNGGDGCSPTCQISPHFSCNGQPSVCTTSCGDGLVLGGEQCDAGNLNGSGGCSATCTIELGYSCYGQPSVCMDVCGNNQVDPGEQCDQGVANGTGTGCSISCQLLFGFTCTGSPSTCYTICGDGRAAGAEQCDNGSLLPIDGCSPTCHIEPGFDCLGNDPSICVAVCGDGLVAGPEQCDSGDPNGAVGCTAGCTVVPGYTCQGQPSVCSMISSPSPPIETTGGGSTGGATGGLPDEGSGVATLPGRLAGGGCLCSSGNVGGDGLLVVNLGCAVGWRRWRRRRVAPC